MDSGVLYLLSSLPKRGMAEEKDLVHLLKLLDDDSKSVRDGVWKALSTRLPDWEGSIRARLKDLPASARGHLEGLLEEKARESFRAGWRAWRNVPGEMAKLEAALSGLSDFLSGRARPASRLPALLDGLAKEFRDAGSPPTPRRLARFLFSEKGMRGADEDYYHARNSDLAQVVASGRGLPISLACVFMLVGHRLGLSIHGCDAPEHFLTRAEEGGEVLIIDCFDAGKVLDKERLSQLESKYAPDFARLLRTPAGAEAIVARVVRNLINAYHLAGEMAASAFMWSLAEDLRGGQGRETGGK